MRFGDPATNLVACPPPCATLGYGAFVDEIDDWINRNEREATQAHNAWLAGQAALQR